MPMPRDLPSQTADQPPGTPVPAGRFRDGVAKVQPPPPEAGAHPRRFMLGVFAAMLVCSAMVFATNYVVDPRNAFPPDHFQPLLEDIYDEQLVRWEGMDPSQDASATVVFGPSTARRIEESVVAATGGGPAYNFATPGSGPEDYAPLYDYMVESERAPGMVLLSLDDFLLLDVSWNKALLPASDAYERVTGETTPLSYTVGELWDSFNPGYFIGSVRVLYYTYVTGYPPMHEAGATGEQADGFAELVAPDVRALFESQYEPSTRFDNEKIEALRALVQHARSNGTAVRIFLPPIHPDVLELLVEKPDYARIHGRALDFAKGLCAPGVQVFDFARTDSFGGDPRAFEDAWHYSPENGRRIVEAMDREPGLCPP